MSVLRAGIIGAGSISEFHTKGYLGNASAELDAVCDIDAERAETYAKTYGIPKVYSDYRELIADDDIDCVSVTTWNNSHAPISIAALDGGKHVLCEKPLSIHAAEAKEMVEAEKRSGKLLMVGFVRRFEDAPNMLRDYIRAGRFGDIYYAKVGYVRKWGNPGGWFSDRSRSGGGPVIDLGVHVIDILRYMTGLPQAVSVSASTFEKLGMLPDILGRSKYMSHDYNPFNDVEDAATALIRFDNGMTLVFETSWTLHTKDDANYVSFFGTSGGVNMEPEFELFGVENNYFTSTKPSVERPANFFEIIFRREVDHFVDCIVNGTTCRCPAEDGLAIMRILDAIYESARTGKEVELT